jgi:RNAse (barnase) inhibitor barstar
MKIDKLSLGAKLPAKGIYFLKDSQGIELLTERTDINVKQLNLIHAKNKHDLLDILSRELKFPDYFGSNWDALEECLGDIAPNSVLFIYGIKNLQIHDLLAYTTFVSILKDAVAKTSLVILRKSVSVPPYKS